MKSLIILVSYHHNNTQEVAEVIAKVLEAQIKSPQQIDPEELGQYDLVGFGSGIYAGKHHELLLDLANKLPTAANKKAFIFSTSGISGRFAQCSGQDSYPAGSCAKFHLQLREKLQSKGYLITAEFICPGFNTNSFLKVFGGINKGRPNAEDLRRAERFALRMKGETFAESV